MEEPFLSQNQGEVCRNETQESWNMLLSLKMIQELIWQINMLNRLVSLKTCHNSNLWEQKFPKW